MMRFHRHFPFAHDLESASKRKKHFINGMCQVLEKKVVLDVCVFGVYKGEGNPSTNLVLKGWTKSHHGHSQSNLEGQPMNPM